MLRFAAQALGREAVVGTALYACTGMSRISNVGLSLTALGVVILWSRWFGLLQPRSWGRAVAEGVLLYGGSVGVGNILLVTLGSCHWAAWL